MNLVVRALTPTFLLCVLCDRGPPTGLGLGSPDQGAEIRAQLAVGPIGGDQLTDASSVLELEAGVVGLEIA